MLYRRVGSEWLDVLSIEHRKDVIGRWGSVLAPPVTSAPARFHHLWQQEIQNAPAFLSAARGWGVGFEERKADSRWSMVQSETAVGRSCVAMDGPAFEKTPAPFFISQ